MIDVEVKPKITFDDFEKLQFQMVSGMKSHYSCVYDTGERYAGRG